MAEKAAEKVRVRFAPSPTGFLHLGGVRTALFNWLYARKNGGTFILRIEDTDKERSKKEFEDLILEGLNWTGLNWDEGVGKNEGYRQSERLGIYKKYLKQLLSEEKAYWCYCSKEDLEAEKQLALAEGRSGLYSGRCRNISERPAGKEPQVIRVKVPAVEIDFEDMIRGKITTDLGLLGDFVIAKNLDEPLYNFAVVVDDHEMGITHVIRGEDHISNTPKQLILQKLLGLPSPIYGHLPLVLNPDRSKLSKRFADVNVMSYKEQGYLPQALLNYLVLLGWHPADDREIFTLKELSEEFDIGRVQKAGAIWNDEKLAWINREHLRTMPLNDLEQMLRERLGDKLNNVSENLFHRVLEVTKERMYTLNDFWNFADFFFELSDYEKELLVWKKGNAEESLEVLSTLRNVFELLAPDYREKDLEENLSSLVTHYGKGNVLWPLRAALSGKEASPDPYTIAIVLGKDESIKRLGSAIDKLI